MKEFFITCVPYILKYGPWVLAALISILFTVMLVMFLRTFYVRLRAHLRDPVISRDKTRDVVYIIWEFRDEFLIKGYRSKEFDYWNEVRKKLNHYREQSYELHHYPGRVD